MKKKILFLFSALTISMVTYAQDAQQALIEAVQAKNLDAVKKVVEELKADVNKPWKQKGVGELYAINIACKVMSPSIETINYLLDKGAKLDVEDNFGISPIMSLVMTHDTTNRLAIFNLLVEKGANINQISKGGGSVLGYACEGNQIEIVKQLLAKGVDVDARKNNFANTPLMYAANGGYEEIVDLLLANGADPKEERKVGQRDGTFAIKTAAVIANEKGHSALANKLASAKKVKVKKK